MRRFKRFVKIEFSPLITSSLSIEPKKNKTQNKSKDFYFVRPQMGHDKLLFTAIFSIRE